jgi:hypothetical protein
VPTGDRSARAVDAPRASRLTRDRATGHAAVAIVTEPSAPLALAMPIVAATAMPNDAITQRPQPCLCACHHPVCPGSGRHAPPERPQACFRCLDRIRAEAWSAGLRASAGRRPSSSAPGKLLVRRRRLPWLVRAPDRSASGRRSPSFSAQSLVPKEDDALALAPRARPSSLADRQSPGRNSRSARGNHGDPERTQPHRTTRPRAAPSASSCGTAAARRTRTWPTNY